MYVSLTQFFLACIAVYTIVVYVAINIVYCNQVHSQPTLFFEMEKVERYYLELIMSRDVLQYCGKVLGIPLFASHVKANI